MLVKVGKGFLTGAIIFLTTYLVHIGIGNLGYLSLADGIIMAFIPGFTASYGILIAGVPMALCDILLGYGQYSVTSFIIKGLEGFLICLLAKKNKNFFVITLVVGIIVLLLEIATDINLYGTILWKQSLLYNGLEIVVGVLFADGIEYFRKKLEK